MPMPSEHAKLSASSSSRWMHCPPSVLISEGIPEVPSEFAQEGTEAHTLCEYKLNKALGKEGENPSETLPHYCLEMEDCATDYAAFVTENVEDLKKVCKDPIVLVEQRLDFSSFVPEGFGTGDCVIIADGTLHVIDFKYGQGVPVDAVDNSQMMLYALGACEMFGILYDISKIVMTIYQPRLSNISSAEISYDELYLWANEILKPLAQMAGCGDGEFKAGDWCRFCKVKAQCKERARENMAIASYEFREPNLLNDDELADILQRIDGLIVWADDVKNYAMSLALSGKKITGFKLVEGRAVRKYADEKKVIEAVSDAGFDPFEKKLIGITAMTSLLGKVKFNEILGQLVIKPKGKPALVPSGDKRKEMTINDFNDMED